ncbi:Bax inhibitor-1 family protein [Pseudanabaena sp. FACHB-2040]|uniref:Bax inhibitor-1/YccA family protein n=1 Tax=Pseudanabaena sp. FACHB-2040 TaxID=2692859 RepID=UPI0016823B59|nr:Bax inhibitor-1 family protein [Pseudanabaena sp. FACHB-2040]MBD2259864.1 US12 family protein [Pseudanabaena sp. FACHB-2040]
MSNTSNFREAIRKAQGQALIGPNVIKNALPYVGGGLVLTAAGAFGGLNVLANNPNIFMPTFWVALIAELALFFVAQRVAAQENNGTALPLLATYSLLSGYTLSGLLYVALGTAGVGINGIGAAALACGITFVAARQIGSNLSEEDGFALTKTIGIGVFAIVIAIVGQFIFSLFGGPIPQFLDIAISGFGVLIFMGAAVVDFFILPRTYKDEQYLSAALSMYLTYINLFIFILRLLIAINRD